MSPRAGLNQDVIVHKALKLAEMEGIDALTIASLARELNIKPPSLYNHFTGLIAIKKAVAIAAMEEMYHYIIQKIEWKSEGKEMIVALAKAYVEFAEQHRGLYEATLHAPDSADSEVQLAGEPMINLTTRAFSVFHLEQEALIHTVRAFRSFLHGLVDLNHRNEFNIPIQVQDTQQWMIDIFIKGLEHRSSS
ncbi:TetR/AcrR family transcriptional regulator [Pontibacillus salicampi]|uniref:TetR/AcrR family transcriptional regulator n=1 Tax=Pontibacillus salicampi TaxID=1449801 RepID=A0ABV6LKQ9_9BACI